MTVTDALLSGILAVQMMQLALLLRIFKAPKKPVGQVQLLKRVGNDWKHIGFRDASHPDIDEALDTPGLAVRHADGRLQTER